jgi:hypothetical protein
MIAVPTGMGAVIYHNCGTSTPGLRLSVVCQCAARHWLYPRFFNLVVLAYFIGWLSRGT